MSSLGPSGTSGAGKDANGRRTVHLNVTFEPASADATVVPRTDGGLPQLVGRDRWLRLAEHVIGGWAATLRVALLMMVVFVGLVVLVGVAFGFSGALLGAAVSGVALYVVGRRYRHEPPR